MFRLVCLALALFLVLPAPARADFAAGEKAYDEKKWVEAIASLRPLADSDDRAAYLLGKMYLDGNGVIPNTEEALRLYRVAASKGNANAMLAIGSIYQGGVGIRRNPRVARAWFKRAAEAGSQFAAFVYATSLFQGDPTGKTDLRQDFAGAYKWFRIAELTGNYPKVREAATATRAAAANRLTAEDIRRIDREAATWTPTDPADLGPMPADVR